MSNQWLERSDGCMSVWLCGRRAYTTWTYPHTHTPLCHHLLTVVALLTVWLPKADMTHAAAAPQRSIAPLDYLHDQYDTAHLNDTEGYLERLSPYPPEVLQIGKVAPFVHSFGPIVGFDGENQGIPGYTSRTEYCRLLSPAELEERIAALRRLTEGAKRRGVRYVMPYSCMLTFFGEPEKRLGLHAVHDHWSEYERWLGPRPSLDPSDWVARNPDGTPWFFYGPRKPAYDPYIRYAACLQNPGWRQWMAATVRNLVAAGYNGIMLDNVGKMRCYCDHCQRAFRAYLKEKHSPEKLKERLGLDSADAANLAPRGADAAIAAGKPKALLIETLEFEIHNIVEFLRFLRAEGRKLDPSFSVCGNTGLIWHLTGSFAEMDVTLVEGHGWWGGLAALKVSNQVYPGLLRKGWDTEVDRYLGDRAEALSTNVFNYQLSHLIPGEHRAYHMTHSPTDSVSVDTLPNADGVLLSYAEAEAFSGGRGTPMPYYSTPFVRAPGLDAFHWMRKSWFAFARHHRGLMVGLVKRPPVGLVLHTKQEFLYGDLNAVLEAERVSRFLAAQNIDFDLIPEYRFDARELSGYQAVIVPQTTYASDDLVRALVDYAQSGGRALVSGERPAAFRDRGTERSDADNPLLPPKASLPAQKRVGKGRLVFYPCYSIDRDPREPDWAKSFRFGEWDSAAFLRALSLSGLDEQSRCLLEEPNPSVGVVRWERTDGPVALVAYHVLNYRVPLGVNRAKHAVPAEGLALRLRLPEGYEAQTAVMYEALYPSETNFSVQERVTPLTLDSEAGLVPLPPVRVYALVAVRCRGT